MKISTIISRGFNLDKWWRLYLKSKKSYPMCFKFMKLYYEMRYMRMASNNGGYCGRTTIIKGKPIMAHGFHGVHISRYAIIGDKCTIFQNVTVTANVVVGDNCIIGAGANLVGPITIGNNVRIGAGTTVVDNIPDNCTVVGVRSRVIQR